MWCLLGMYLSSHMWILDLTFKIQLYVNDVIMAEEYGMQ